MNFRKSHPELQQLAREVDLIRNHNLKFKEGDPQDTLLLFAEAALVLLTLERFVRAVLAPDVTDQDTIYTLLQRAVKLGLLRVPWDDQEEGIKKIKEVRNTLLHGNYEQAARQTNRASVEEYFKTQFAPEVGELYKITDFLMKQIDPDTGQPYPSP